MNQSIAKIVASLAVALGIILGALVLGIWIEKARMANNYVTVKGLAEMKVKADLGIWTPTVRVTNGSLSGLSRQLDYYKKTIQGYFNNFGFSNEEFQILSVSISQNTYNYSNTPHKTDYTGTISMRIVTKDVDQLAKAASSAIELAKKGIIFNSDDWQGAPSYQYTNINSIKPKLLSEAIKAAKDSALSFSKQAHTHIKGIHKADQGVITISPVAQGQGSNNSTIDKTVRDVVTITYIVK